MSHFEPEGKKIWRVLSLHSPHRFLL